MLPPRELPRQSINDRDLALLSAGRRGMLRWSAADVTPRTRTGKTSLRDVPPALSNCIEALGLQRARRELWSTASSSWSTTTSRRDHERDVASLRRSRAPLEPAQRRRVADRESEYEPALGAACAQRASCADAHGVRRWPPLISSLPERVCPRGCVVPVRYDRKRSAPVTSVNSVHERLATTPRPGRCVPSGATRKPSFDRRSVQAICRSVREQRQQARLPRD